MAEKITLVLADPYHVIREGIKRLINANADMTVIGEACNGKEAITAVEKLHPDVLLLELDMPCMCGEEVVDHLIKNNGQTKIVILTAKNDPGLKKIMMQKGVAGFYSKAVQPGRLVNGIQRIITSGT